MDLFIVFIITLGLITIAGVYFRISPFFTLIGGTILFGLLAGMGPEQVILGIISGIGKVFSIFGIIIFSGAVIAALLSEQHQIEEIVSDMRRRVANPAAISGLSGYVLSVPITCCITAFVMLTPIIGHLEKHAPSRNALLYLAAVGSLISYALVYPTPVVIPLFDAFGKGISGLLLDAVTIPLSLAILAGYLFVAGRYGKHPNRGQSQENDAPAQPSCNNIVETAPQCRPGSFHPRAWAPFIAIVLMIPVSVLLGLSHSTLIQVIMLAGAAVAIILAPAAVRNSGIQKGAKHAGLIIFDICGAGALGFIIVESGFAQGALTGISAFFPIILVPFLLAALIETAQGSRIVTAVISADILAGTQVVQVLHPVPLILMVAAGSCIFSYVTDPYFWLVQRTTGDDLGIVVRNYTVPLAIIGGVLLIASLCLQFLVFGPFMT